MPIGVSLVAPRYHDRHLLAVSKAVGAIFETQGGWKRDIPSSVLRVDEVMESSPS